MDERPPMERAMSTDVVMDIVLSHLKVRDLLSCRKVSKFWNKAASSVLRRRSTMIKAICYKQQFMELEECLKQSSDFPFTGLKLYRPWTLSFAAAMKFVENYGEKFTSLCLRTTFKTRIQELALVQFLNHLPRLSILEVDSAWECPRRVELFDSAAGQEGGQTLNLPSLRTLRISTELSQDVLREVFRAASSELQIEVPDAEYGILSALKSAGMLQAVSVLKVEANMREEDIAFVVFELLSTAKPKLTKLDLKARGRISQEGLMKLLISSKDTLKYLKLDGICPSEFSSECPVLTKLTKLSLIINYQSYEYVFQGKQGHKFPALRELKLCNWDRTFDPLSADMADGLFTVPSVTRIELHGLFNKKEMTDLARCFPNVIEIRLDYWEYRGDPSEIWGVGAFKLLQKLTIWQYRVNPPTKNLMSMDRFLTGMSIGICNNLRKHAQQNLTNSPFNEILRESPSILQLKNLKQLTVSVDLLCEGRWEELPEEPPFISMVSLWYALQMMPNLEARFVYETSLLSEDFEEDEIDKAVTVLRSAFKHVQPYVELKPFFY